MGKQTLTLILSFLVIASCAHRGMKIGHQIPQYNHQFNEEEKQIWAEGGNKEKIVYGEMEEKTEDHAKSQKKPHPGRGLSHEKSQQMIQTTFGQKGYLVNP